MVIFARRPSESFSLQGTSKYHPAVRLAYSTSSCFSFLILLGKVGILTAQSLIKFRRFAIVLIFIVCMSFLFNFF